MDATTTRQKLMRLEDGLLIGIFFCAIGMPAVLHRFLPDESEFVHRENRVPASRPGWPADRADLRAWPGAFSAWYDDAFAGRRFLIRTHSRLWLEWLDSSPSGACLLGREGWMFTRDNRAVEKQLGLTGPDDGELEAAAATLERRRLWLEERGIAYLVVIGPDKHGIYPEMLPEGIVPRPGLRPLDRFLKKLGSATRAIIVDPRERLAREKKEATLYFPLGTHWNEWGAALVAELIVERARQDFPGMTPLDSHQDLSVRAERGLSDSWGRQLHLEDRLLQDFPDVEPHEGFRALRLSGWVTGPKDLVTERVDSDGPSVLLLHDSFGEAPRLFLAEHCRRLSAVWNLHFDDGLIETLAPDLVVEIVVERNLDGVVFDGGGKLALNRRAGRGEIEEAIGRWENPPLGVIEIAETSDGLLEARSRLGTIALERRSRGLWAGRGESRATRLRFDRGSDAMPRHLILVDPRLRLPMPFFKLGTDPAEDPRRKLAGRFDRQGQVFQVFFTGSDLLAFAADGQFLGLLEATGDDSREFEVKGRLLAKVHFDEEGLELILPQGRTRARRLP